MFVHYCWEVGNRLVPEILERLVGALTGASPVAGDAGRPVRVISPEISLLFDRKFCINESPQPQHN